MKRRFFSKMVKSFLVGVAATQIACRKLLNAADSWFRWPSYPSTEALRRHIATSSNHPEYKWNHVKNKSRSQLISMHDSSHFKRGNSAPLRKTTYKKKKSVPAKPQKTPEQIENELWVKSLQDENHE